MKSFSFGTLPPSSVTSLLYYRVIIHDLGLSIIVLRDYIDNNNNSTVVFSHILMSYHFGIATSRSFHITQL